MTVHNLPSPAKSFVGRDKELTEIAQLLANPDCRLLTLVGPGGIGKTRLAIEAARQTTFRDGCHFVTLQPLTSPEFMVNTIADVMGIRFYQADNPRGQLLNSLRNKSLLLLLDNLEHLLDGVGLLLEILSTAPEIKLLVTSRERLNLQEEWAFPLDGLSFPRDKANDGLENYSAAQLFIQRARQIRADFSLNGNRESIVTICQQLEGMPLGIELAASWLRAMTCAQIAANMGDSPNFLTTSLRNIHERHRSLAAVFEQSWNMLTAAEQNVLKRLSVFRGGFDLEAATAVAGASLPLLAALVDKSLIRLNSTGRYELHEMLRQFAGDKLVGAGETDVIIRRFCDHYLKLAESIEAHNFGYEQVTWYDRAEIEWDNFRAALSWSKQDETGLRIAAALGWFFTARAYWQEGLDWLERALQSNSEASASLRAHALYSAGAVVGLLGDKHQAQSLLEQALGLADEADDLRSMGWSLAHMGLFPDFNANERVLVLEKSLKLFRELGDPMGLAHTLYRRSEIAWRHQRPPDYAYARRLLDESAIYANKANDRIMSGWISNGKGWISFHCDSDLHKARSYFGESMAFFREAHFMDGYYLSLLEMTDVEVTTGNIISAQIRAENAIRLLQQTDVKHPLLVWLLVSLANIVCKQGDYELAARLWGAAYHFELARTLSAVGSCTHLPTVLDHLGEVAFAEAFALGQKMELDQLINDAIASIKEQLQAHTKRIGTGTLTKREIDILRLTGDGLNSREIAERLVLSIGTVRWYLKQIYSKLDAHSRAEAIARARELNLLA